MEQGLEMFGGAGPRSSQDKDELVTSSKDVSRRGGPSQWLKALVRQT